MHCAVFDTSLLKQLVPLWHARVPFSQGVAQAIATFESHPDWRTVDDDANAMFDRLGSIYRNALREVEAV